MLLPLAPPSVGALPPDPPPFMPLPPLPAVGASLSSSLQALKKKAAVRVAPATAQSPFRFAIRDWMREIEVLFMT
jgi:hypothetical protein